MNSEAPRPVWFVLGIGRDRSLLEVVNLSVEELKRTDGAPRRLVAEGDGVRLIAERAEWHGDFTSLRLRTAMQPDVREQVEELCAAGDGCTLEAGEEEDTITLRSASGLSELQSVIEQLSEVLPLPETWRVRGDGHRDAQVSVDMLFELMAAAHASDMHLYPGSPPVLRVNGNLVRAEDVDPLSAGQIIRLIRELAPDAGWQQFEAERQCSFRYHQVGRGYSRVSAFMRVHAPHCTLRYLPESIPTFEDLRLPVEKMQRLASLHDGLLLVTGMTGSGKSTTVASILDWINTNEAKHILTIEDPIEFVHRNRKAMVSQRELGADFDSFTDAVRGALRQDPDVVFVGEMRDADTIRAVIDAAATGHLVISILHAATAAEAANRIVSFFEPVERDLVRIQLHECLRCIVSQRLVPRKGGGRVLALEYLYNDTRQISDSLLSGNTRGLRIGMQQTLSDSSIFEESLFQLLKAGQVTEDDALAFAPNPASLEQMKIGTYRPPALDSMLHDH